MSLVDDLIRSGEYRIKIIHRSAPLWTMHIPQVRGLFGWKTIYYNPNTPSVYTGYFYHSFQSRLDLAQQAIINHYNQTHTTTEIYEPTPKD